MLPSPPLCHQHCPLYPTPSPTHPTLPMDITFPSTLQCHHLVLSLSHYRSPCHTLYSS
jgi:hypothetical protein